MEVEKVEDGDAVEAEDGEVVEVKEIEDGEVEEVEDMATATATKMPDDDSSYKINRFLLPNFLQIWRL